MSVKDVDRGADVASEKDPQPEAGVSREQAIQHFTGGALNLAANLTRGRVRSIAELYIPYSMFRVKITSGSREQGRILARMPLKVCWICLNFPRTPPRANCSPWKTRNVLPSSLDDSRLRDRMIAKVRRIFFAQGFFKLRDLQIDADVIPGNYCVPYWVCFRGVSGTAHLAVLDAVRRKREGAKVRHMIEEWLRSDGDIRVGGSRGFQDWFGLRPGGVCVVAILSPLRGSVLSNLEPTAYAVGCILTPLHG